MQTSGAEQLPRWPLEPPPSPLRFSQYLFVYLEWPSFSLLHYDFDLNCSDREGGFFSISFILKTSFFLLPLSLVCSERYDSEPVSLSSLNSRSGNCDIILTVSSTQQPVVTTYSDYFLLQSMLLLFYSIFTVKFPTFLSIPGNPKIMHTEDRDH